MRVDLSAEERQRYEADYAIYAGFFHSRQLPSTYGPRWFAELTRLSAFDREAGRALLAQEA